MERVRLTIQIRGSRNLIRTTHSDVPLSKVREQASESAADLARFFTKQQRRPAEADEQET